MLGLEKTNYIKKESDAQNVITIMKFFLDNREKIIELSKNNIITLAEIKEKKDEQIYYNYILQGPIEYVKNWREQIQKIFDDYSFFIFNSEQDIAIELFQKKFKNYYIFEDVVDKYNVFEDVYKYLNFLNLKQKVASINDKKTHFYYIEKSKKLEFENLYNKVKQLDQQRLSKLEINDHELENAEDDLENLKNIIQESCSKQDVKFLYLHIENIDENYYDLEIYYIIQDEENIEEFEQQIKEDILLREDE